MTINFEDWESNLLARIDRGLKFGKSLGIDALELYISNSRSLNVNIKGGILKATQGGNTGVGCRCLTGKKIGFASASGIGDSAVNFVIESALKVSKALPKEDDRWSNFVQTSQTGRNGIIDMSVVEISSEEVVNGANLIFKEAKDYDPRILSIEGFISVGYGAFAVGNTEGLLKSARNTSSSIEASVVATENSKSKKGASFTFGRGVPKFDGIGTIGARKAIALLDSKPLEKTAQMNVIFNNLAVAELIQSGLENSINGQSVIEGKSIFAEKLGEQVGVPSLTLYDDGQIPEDPKMVSIDDEGHPRKKTLIIDKGVLKSFIFDQYYSNIYSTDNTGNAKRQGPQTYESLPKISPTTISIEPGKKNIKELASEINDGVFVEDILLGMHTADTISGDFSIVAPNCYKIENGEITTPLEPVSIAGNLYKAFKQITSLGNEIELTPFGKMPSIAFEGFTVSG
ncbi:MAG: TldD/PmbA family protein [Promethearchaeota archaeon]